jgi:hypothetical protein
MRRMAEGNVMPLGSCSGTKIISTTGTQRIADSHLRANRKVVQTLYDQLKRLVEQHKQDLLFDDQAFKEELNDLIIDYLQLLPRNAKRVLNRLRVNLLIAYRQTQWSQAVSPTKDSTSLSIIHQYIKECVATVIRPKLLIFTQT